MMQLKPCPFCGGLAHIVTGEECAYVQCEDVKMHRALWFDGDNAAADEVAEQWNRREARNPPFPEWAAPKEVGVIEDCTTFAAELAALEKRLADMRETFCLASPGSDEEIHAWLHGFDAAAAILAAPHDPLKEE